MYFEVSGIHLKSAVTSDIPLEDLTSSRCYQIKSELMSHQNQFFYHHHPEGFGHVTQYNILEFTKRGTRIALHKTILNHTGGSELNPFASFELQSLKANIVLFPNSQSAC